MSVIGTFAWNPPGISTMQESYEVALSWGPDVKLTWWNPSYISSSTTDPTNTPTTRLRQGLLMGLITSSGQWINYDADNTDGSQIALGVLGYGVNMLDLFTNSAVNKLIPIIIGGPVQAASLVGLDTMARAQMYPRFLFTDSILGNYNFPWKKSVTKTADYTVTAADNGTEFNTLGASGSVTFTLPTLTNGLSYTFYNMANQNMVISSAAGNDIVAMNDLSASTLTFSTGGELIGACVQVYSNMAGTKWLARNLSAGANTMTPA